VGRFSWTGTALSFDRDENVFRVAATNRYDYIDVHVHTDQTLVETDEKLKPSDELIAFQVLGGERTPFLLILALIMNAANEKRALVTCSKDKPEVGEVDVYLTRTENGDLRIMNLIKKMDKSIEQINQLLERPPRRDGGISLWSMSRYMKSVISTLISNCIQQGEERMQKQPLCERKIILHDMKTCIEELMGINYQVRAEEIDLQEAKGFCVCVPVLTQKYDNYKQYFKETL
jgi:UTP-glucose-1-phosphate uridylyltransferase